MVTSYQTTYMSFDVLLTVHLSIFISVFNQLDAQNLFHNKFYFMLLHVSSTCAEINKYDVINKELNICPPEVFSTYINIP